MASVGRILAPIIVVSRSPRNRRMLAAPFSHVSICGDMRGDVRRVANKSGREAFSITGPDRLRVRHPSSQRVAQMVERTQPFTAPSASPRTRCRCNAIMKATIGSMMPTAAAADSDQ